MTPPEAPVAGETAKAADVLPAVCVRPAVLRKRADFLRTAKARRVAMPGFVVQARRQDDSETPNLQRVGFTCSKKVGNAVARNRAKRRLREISATVIPVSGLGGWDYVLIGRRDVTASRPYLTLCEDLRKALRILHQKA